MIIHLHLIGFILIALALVHFIFPKYFDWKNELDKLGLINKQMIYVHTFFIALIVLMMGILCLKNAQDLTETRLGSRLCLGLAIFWGCRLLIQFFGYSAQLWKGKKFETFIHVLFSLLWTYFTTLFFLSFLLNKSV